MRVKKGDEWALGRGDSRYAAEALRGGLEYGRQVKLRSQWLEYKEAELEGLG